MPEYSQHWIEKPADFIFDIEQKLNGLLIRMKGDGQRGKKKKNEWIILTLNKKYLPVNVNCYFTSVQRHIMNDVTISYIGQVVLQKKKKKQF